MAISAVGTLTPVEGTNQLTFQITTTTVGNVVVVGCRGNTPSLNIDTISGGGCTWTQGPEFFSTLRGRRYEIWYGVVNTVVTNATVTVTWSGDMSAKTMAYNPQEFTNGTSSSWALDGAGGGVETSSTATTFAWPVLTAAAAGELYFGQGSANTGTMSSGTPAGFVFKNTTNYWMYGVAAASGSVAPVSTSSGSATYGGVAGLLKATALTPNITTTLTIAPTLSVTATTSAIPRNPGSAFNLTGWSLTNPLDVATPHPDADEVTLPSLNSYYDTSYFYLDSSSRMVMIAPVNGATTSGSTGVRTELREWDGASRSAWSMASTSRKLTVSAYYDASSITGGSNPRPEMIIGQIHATGGTPPIYITADYSVTPTRMRVYKDGPGVGNLITGFGPTDLVSFSIEITQGNVNIYGAFGPASSLPTTPQFSYASSSFAESTGCYLKAGAYNKTDTGTGSTGQAQATIAYLNLNQAYTPTTQVSLSLTATPTITVNSLPIGVLSASFTIPPSLTINGVVSFGKQASLILTATPTISLSGRVTEFAASLLLTATVTFTATVKITTFAVLLLSIIPRLTIAVDRGRPQAIFTRYPYPPPEHPFRIIAQEVLSGNIVEWDLPVQSDFSYTTQLSGPTVMSGSFKPEIISVQELGLDGYAYFFHVEIDDQIRATGLFLPPKYNESSLEFTCEGFAAMPHYVTWEGSYSVVGADPLSIARSIWNHVQSNSLSNLGVVVSNNSSPQKLGTPARTDVTANADGTTTSTDVAAEPYELQWWDAVNCGEEIDNLATQTPFDYKERVAWNTTHTYVNLFIDLGYPRLGVPRPNLLFNDENIMEIVPIQEKVDSFASEVIVIGSGEGSATIRGYAAQTFGKRIRKVHVVTDKTISTTARANTVATSELGLRKGNLFSIDELVVRAKHANATLGEYDVGDDIFVNVNVPWLMGDYGAWYRINSINYTPINEIVRLSVQRSDTYRYPVV